MKFGISPQDKLALVISIVPHECHGAERQDTRLTAWDDLCVREFARVASRAMQRQPYSFKADDLAPFADGKAVLVDLQPSTVQFLIDEIAAGVPGVYQDQLTELRHDLKRLQEKTYRLPDHLRDEKPAKK
jgi:hypothetical protein